MIMSSNINKDNDVNETVMVSRPAVMVCTGRHHLVDNKRLAAKSGIMHCTANSGWCVRHSNKQPRKTSEDDWCHSNSRTPTKGSITRNSKDPKESTRSLRL